MGNRKILFTTFILVALIQLYIPAKMIWNREEVLEDGTTFKFKTVPIDPNDPFRGKYITLRYPLSFLTVEDETEWSINEEVYALVANNETGFARIESISKEEPLNHPAYFKVNLSKVSKNGSNEVSIVPPFNRFYMEESKAPAAESIYFQAQS